MLLYILCYVSDQFNKGVQVNRSAIIILSFGMPSREREIEKLIFSVSGVVFCGFFTKRVRAFNSIHSHTFLNICKHTDQKSKCI